MHALYVLSVWVHILAAATWIGGSLFLVFVLVPAALVPEWRDRGSALIHRVAGRFVWVGWICFAVLIATGLFNLFVRGGSSWEYLGRREFWSSSFGKMLAGKLVLVGVILMMSAIHSFVLGPLAKKAFGEDPALFRTGRLRLMLRWEGRLSLLLGLIVVGLGVTLVRGWPW